MKSSAPRLLLGLGLVALVGWLLLALFSEGAAEAQPTSFTSSRQCAECHPLQYEEWSGSQHAKSWTNPFVRELSNDFANQDCIDCHAPRPIFHSGIGQRVLPRAVRRVEGVDCIACHELPDGRMAGTIDDPTVACRPVLTKDLARPEFCVACHDQHQTVTQWRESSWPDRGFDCLDCHMPFRDGDESKGRAHHWFGGTKLENLQKAVELRAERSGASIGVEVENVGAGHAFPTDERSRAADVFWRPAAVEGGEPGAWRHLYRFRSPYRHEADLPDTLLAADGTWSGTIEDAPADAVEVALFYKRSPYWKDAEAPDPDGEATRVHTVLVEP